MYCSAAIYCCCYEVGGICSGHALFMWRPCHRILQAPLGLRIRVLDPTPDCPASTVGAEQVQGSFRDPESIRAFSQGVDMLTVEIEHVDADALESAARAAGIEVHPSPAVLRVIQDKWAQKRHFGAAGVPCAAASSIDSEEELKAFGDTHGYPFMLKARRLAYDGRGNAVVHDEGSAAEALASLGGISQGLYAEAWVPFKAEIAVMVARERDGSLTPFPLVQTLHRDSICVVTEAPAAVEESVRERALKVALAAVASLPGAGVYGVEMFLAEDGTVLLNEVAPRPHNSGHYTIEACSTSQYTAHLQAVTGRAVGPTGLIAGASIMLNILGDDTGPASNRKRIDAMQAVAEREHTSMAFHWYGKDELKHRRKLGHITITAPTRREARRLLQTLDSASAVELERAAPIEAAESLEASGPRVGILMGSDSDLPTMRAAAEILTELGIPVEVEIVSAHRTPDLMGAYARSAAARGIRVIVAGAGGAAHLPGMLAAQTALPVIGVPVVPSGQRLDGIDALLSICQMPRGIPVATVAIGNAANAGLLAARILGASDPALRARMEAYQAQMTETVLEKRRVMATKGWASY